MPEGSAFRFPSVLGELENGVRWDWSHKLLRRWVVSPPVPSVTTPCDWASGASLLIRGAVFEAIGLLDENYFLYFEEVDFCLRARRAGWTCWYVPQAQVLHLAGQSSGRDWPKLAERDGGQDYWFERGDTTSGSISAPGERCWPTWPGRSDSFRSGSAAAPAPRIDTEPPFLLRDFIYYNFLPGKR